MPRMDADPSREGIVRAFEPADAPHLTAIVEESPQAAAWAPGAASQLAETEAASIYVGESGGEITGFVIGRQIGDEAEILNLAVRRHARRKGHATALLLHILRHWRQSRVTRVFLEVRDSNAPAILFYEKHGFRQVGRRPGYYRQPDEAALIFERKLTG